MRCSVRCPGSSKKELGVGIGVGYARGKIGESSFWVVLPAIPYCLPQDANDALICTRPGNDLALEAYFRGR